MRTIQIGFLPCLFLVLNGCAAGQAADGGEPLGKAGEPLSVSFIPTLRSPIENASALFGGAFPFIKFEGLITFDDVASGTNVASQYPGVTLSSLIVTPQNTVVEMPNAYALADPSGTAPVACSTLFVTNPPSCPATGNDISISGPPVVLPEFSGRYGAVKATFATPKTWAAIMAIPNLGFEWFGAVTNEPYIEAFDPNGNFLGETLYPYTYGSSQWGTWQKLAFNAPAGTTIGSVVFSTQAYQSSTDVFAAFDNLSYFPAN